MKDATKVAGRIHDRMWRGVSNVSVQLLNEQLTPIESALVAIRLYDMASDHHKGIIARNLEKGQREHFVLDERGTVVLVFDSRQEAEKEADRLPGDLKVISGASK